MLHDWELHNSYSPTFITKEGEIAAAMKNTYEILVGSTEARNFRGLDVD
jgi:hypothetical protein